MQNATTEVLLTTQNSYSLQNLYTEKALDRKNINI